jgi:hypothetical protein
MKRAVCVEGIVASLSDSDSAVDRAAEAGIGDTWRECETTDEAMAVRSRSASPARRRPAPETEHSSRRAPAAGNSSATVAGVRISHPDRVIYPDLLMSKIEFARYFDRIAG